MERLVDTRAGRLAIFTAMTAFSLVIANPASGITWGQADEGQHPNVGAIMGYYGEELGWLPSCSGTLISDRVFLTAGHCTFGTPPDSVYVCFDEDPLAAGATFLEVEAIITHPKYNWRRSNPYDVGVLILKEPVTDITPATVATEGYLDDLRAQGLLRQGKEEADFTVVGYGATLLWPPPGILWEDKRQYTYSEYQVLLKSWLRLSQNQATDDGGSSYGDSGGPIFWEDGDTDILVAVTSWGDASCVATAFGYRTDTTDTWQFIDFANGWLDEAATDDPEVP